MWHLWVVLVLSSGAVGADPPWMTGEITDSLETFSEEAQARGSRSAAASVASTRGRLRGSERIGAKWISLFDDRKGVAEPWY